jgi:predicted RNA-binding protein YlqC (UPF0109 family)
MAQAGSVKVKEWLDGTVRLIVDDPGQVRIEEVMSPDEGTSYFSIYCAYDDLGKVIGREGSNINALRKLAGAMCLSIYKRRCEVTTHDPKRDERRR